MFEIRPLRPDEADQCHAIGLEALRAHPAAFSASAEQGEDGELPLAWFADRLADAVVFGGSRGGLLLGTAGFRGFSGLKLAHKALLWGVCVRPAARGTGLARALVEIVSQEMV